MPTNARVRPQHVRRRRAFAVIAAIAGIALATPAAAQPVPTAAVLKVGNAKSKPVVNAASVQDQATGLKGAIRWLTREFMSRVRGPDRTSNKNA